MTKLFENNNGKTYEILTAVGEFTLLVNTNPEYDYHPYVVAVDLDEANGDWKEGYYYASLADAKKSYAKKGGQRRKDAKERFVEGVIRNSIRLLKSSGYEDGTFLNQESPYHEEAFEDVVEWSTETIVDTILDKASEQLDNSVESNLAYSLLTDGIHKRVEKLVTDTIYDVYDLYC